MARQYISELLLEAALKEEEEVVASTAATHTLNVLHTVVDFGE
jgi:hypothetical protein